MTQTMKQPKISEITTEVMKVISRSLTTTINQLEADMKDLPMQIINDIQSKGLQIVGPAVFVYTGSMETHDTPFTLQICYPVKDHSSYRGEFHATQLESKTFYQGSFTGHLKDIGEKGWMPFVESLSDQKIKPGLEAREVYVDWQGMDSHQNKVLLQYEK